MALENVDWMRGRIGSFVRRAGLCVGVGVAVVGLSACGGGGEGGSESGGGGDEADASGAVTTPGAGESVAMNGGSEAGAEVVAAADDGLTALERIRQAAAAKREQDEVVRQENLASRLLEQNAATMGPMLDPREIRTDMRPGDNAYISFDADTFDFGTVYTDEKLDGQFVFVNEGTEALTIESITTSCGCTAANKDELVGKVFAPGESGLLKVGFTPQGVGEIGQTVTVRSNSGGGKTSTLRVVANYIAPVKIASAFENLSQTPAVDGVSTFTYVEARDAGAEIDRVLFTGPAATANNGVSPVFASSWERVEAVSAEYPARFKVVFETHERPRVGAFNEAARIYVTQRLPETGEVVERDVPIRLVGQLTSVLQIGDGLQSQFVRVPTVLVSEEFEHRETLRRADGLPFEVRSVTLDQFNVVKEGEFEVDVVEVEGSGGTAYEIVTRGTAPAVQARFGARVILETDIDSEGPFEVRIRGASRPSTADRVSQAPAR